MNEVKIAGIMRAGVFSPNHIGNDAAVFNAVVEQLRKRGMTVNIYNEEQLNAGAVKESVIVNMCRHLNSIKLLQEYEDAGRIVINSAYGIENCFRDRTARLLMGNHFPYPKSVIVDTNESVRALLRKEGIDACWIKRGDTHSMHKEDVSFCRHPEEAQEVLQEYFLRGIKRAVISAHIAGNEIKFYGVKDTPFFKWYYSSPSRPMQHETLIREVNPTKKLKKICSSAAEELNVMVYGGDCIVNEKGEITIVDFNDWPSYAPCRSEAAAAIARRILKEIETHNV
jgi:hypothetical protein